MDLPFNYVIVKGVTGEIYTHGSNVTYDESKITLKNLNDIKLITLGSAGYDIDLYIDECKDWEKFFLKNISNIEALYLQNKEKISLQKVNWSGLSVLSLHSDNVNVEAFRECHIKRFILTGGDLMLSRLKELGVTSITDISFKGGSVTIDFPCSKFTGVKGLDLENTVVKFNRTNVSSFPNVESVHIANIFTNNKNKLFSILSKAETLIMNMENVKGFNLIGEELKNITIKNISLIGITFTGKIDLSKVKLENISFEHCKSINLVNNPKKLKSLSINKIDMETAGNLLLNVFETVEFVELSGLPYFDVSLFGSFPNAEDITLHYYDDIIPQKNFENQYTKKRVILTKAVNLDISSRETINLSILSLFPNIKDLIVTCKELKGIVNINKLKKLKKARVFIENISESELDKIKKQFSKPAVKVKNKCLIFTY